MKTKLYIVFLLLILAFYSNILCAVDVSNSSGAERLNVNSNILRFVPNWNDGLDVSLSSLTFSQASNGAVELSGDGVGSHNFQLGWLTFIGDTSGSNEGAVYLHTQTQSQLPNNFFYLTNSAFANNSALSGRAIYMASNNSQNHISFSVTTGTFSQNSVSAGNGRALNYSDLDLYIVSSSVFQNNSVSLGGAIYNAKGNIYLTSVADGDITF
jgi:hypothetical protein